MKYVVDMGAGATIYVPSFIQIGSGIRKVMGGGAYSICDPVYRPHLTC
jgi:hypothetical protein